MNSDDTSGSQGRSVFRARLLFLAQTQSQPVTNVHPAATIHPDCARIIHAIREAAGLCITILVLAFAGTSVGAENEASDAQVKAAFVLSFPNYIEWPAESFAASNSPVVFGFFGKTDVRAEFQRITAGSSVNGRPVVVRQLITEDECMTAHIHVLFIGDHEQRVMPRVLRKVRGRPILTVGDVDDFLERGGTINLERRNDSMRVQVNLAAARAAKLKVSSKLLTISEVRNSN